MPYELDSTTESSTASDADERAPPESDADETESSGAVGESLGVRIPDEHVGPFVAEVFEDPERSTSWADVVDELVAPDARDAWEAMCPGAQATEVLSRAGDYDRRAVERFDSVPLDGSADVVPEAVREGLRCRRNADAFRNAVADAYADGHLDDDALIAAVEAADFETDAIARREDLLEQVDSVYDVSFRPYGGTLMDADDGPDPDVDHDASETW